MSLEQPFIDAQQRVQSLSKRASNEDLLELYSLYKQSTVGDVTGKRPGMLDMKGRAKYDAWAKRKGSPKEATMQAYVAKVESLLAADGG